MTRGFDTNGSCRVGEPVQCTLVSSNAEALPIAFKWVLIPIAWSRFNPVLVERSQDRAGRTVKGCPKTAAQLKERDGFAIYSDAGRLAASRGYRKRNKTGICEETP